MQRLDIFFIIEVVNLFYSHLSMQYRNSFVQWLKHFTQSSQSTNNSIVLGSELKPSRKDKQEATVFSFSKGQITIFWIIGALVAYASYLVFRSLSLLYLILTGLLISVAMESFIMRLQKWMKR